jgi:hypothetical protein
VQTYRERAPLDLDAVPVLLAVAGLAVLVTCALIALRALAARQYGPARPSAPQQLTG